MGPIFMGTLISERLKGNFGQALRHPLGQDLAQALGYDLVQDLGQDVENVSEQRPQILSKSQ